ncbi:MAG: pirin family protein [Nannocystaceae bacterium]
MLTLRPADARGGGRFGWLDTRHTFSFGHYHDPAHMGFRALRVLNDDRVTPGAGFPTHSHRDAEIISYVLDGAIEHRDSMGNGSVIRPGEVQRMSAGRGVSHSEFNASKTDGLRFLQIWFIPSRRGIEPGYEQREFSAAERAGKLRVVASPDARAGSVTVHADVVLYSTLLSDGDAVTHELDAGRHAWVQVARGEVELRVGDEVVRLREGDGAAISEEPALGLVGTGDAEVLVFDLA